MTLFLAQLARNIQTGRRTLKTKAQRELQNARIRCARHLSEVGRLRVVDAAYVHAVVREMIREVVELRPEIQFVALADWKGLGDRSVPRTPRRSGNRIRTKIAECAGRRHYECRRVQELPSANAWPGVGIGGLIRTLITASRAGAGGREHRVHWQPRHGLTDAGNLPSTKSLLIPSGAVRFPEGQRIDIARHKDAPPIGVRRAPGGAQVVAVLG